MAPRIPVFRQLSWIALIPLISTVLIVYSIGTWNFGEFGGLVGTVALYAYFIGARLWIGRYHRAGIAFVKRGQFANAIPLFRKSLEFFDLHAWIDRWRSVVLMSLSAISFREMAICNTAFCYSQIGDGMLARENYEECLRRFPDSGLAIAALRMLDSGMALSDQKTASVQNDGDLMPA